VWHFLLKQCSSVWPGILRSIIKDSHVEMNSKNELKIQTVAVTHQLVTEELTLSATHLFARLTREAHLSQTHPAGLTTVPHTHTHTPVNQTVNNQPLASSFLYLQTPKHICFPQQSFSGQIKDEFQSVRGVEHMKKTAPITSCDQRQTSEPRFSQHQSHLVINGKPVNPGSDCTNHIS